MTTTVDDEVEMKQLRRPASPSTKLVVFDAIVVTAAKPAQARAYEIEMLRRQGQGRIQSSCVVMSVADPSGCRIGSGGATLNALYCVAQRLQQQPPASSASSRSSSKLASVLSDKRILILHSGGDSRRNPICSVTGKAFSTLPSIVATGNEEAVQLNAPIDFLISMLSSVCEEAGAGVWIGCTDVLLNIPVATKIAWPSTGVTGLAIPTSPTVGVHHGVYRVEDDGDSVLAFVQKPSLATQQAKGLIRADDTVLVDSGVVYMSLEAATTFLDLAYVQPFSGCTADGHDAGQQAFRFELYTDVLCCLNDCVPLDEYQALCTQGSVPTDTETYARTLMWQRFHSYSFHCCVSGGQFIHLGTTGEYLSFITRPPPHQRDAYSLVRLAACSRDYPTLNTSPRAVCVNSVLQGRGSIADGALVEHSHLTGMFRVETGGIMSGVRTVGGLHCRQGVVIQQQVLSATAFRNHPYFHHSSSSSLSSSSSPPSVIFMYAVGDGIKDTFDKPTATFMGVSWHQFLATHRIDTNEVWPHVSTVSGRSLWNARLFPVFFSTEMDADCTLWLQYVDDDSTITPSHNTMFKWRQSVRVSLEDILALSDPAAEFQWRHDIGFLLDKRAMVEVLLGEQNRSLLNVVSRWSSISHKQQLLQLLDNIAASAPPHIAARTFCVIGDVLSSYPDSALYKRSGNAQHKDWHHALKLLSAGNIGAAVAEMREKRTQWLEEATSDVIRSARHYDAAAFYLIRSCVSNVTVTFDLLSSSVAYAKRVCVRAPVRVDLAGGWSDTPPICYEYGGSVVNAAVLIDDEYPLGCTVKRVTNTTITLITGVSPVDDDENDIVHVCTSFSDFADHSNPHAPAALMKCVLLAMDIVPRQCLRPRDDDDDDDDGGGGGGGGGNDIDAFRRQLHSVLNPHNYDDNNNMDVGLEIRLYSTLPQGTGLGVSSILAAAMAAAVARAVHRRYSSQSLIHLVLLVEQLLTTGGGWQDQAGAVLGGFKLVTSSKLPIEVNASVLQCDDEFVRSFNEHALLLYTGGSRLARDLLQTVIRRWYHRSQHVMNIVEHLCENALQMSNDIVEHGDLEAVGRRLDMYWTHKKAMASDAEPEHCRRLMDKLRPLSVGMSLCGAGGGGFMLVLTKQPNVYDEVKTLLSDEINNNGITLHRVKVCLTGLQTNDEY